MNWRYPIFKLKHHAQGSVNSKLRELRYLFEQDQAFNEKYREDALRKLIIHAYNNVPYYKEVFDKAQLIDHSSNVNLSNFRYVPSLTKTIIKDNFEALTSKDSAKRKPYLNYSGGATGQPVKLLQDKEYSDWAIAVTLLFDEWCDYKPGMTKVKFWGSERDLFIGKETLKTKVGRWIKNEHWLNAFKMSHENLQQYLNEWNRLKPKLVLAYADAIYEFACFVEKQNLESYSPQCIMTSAGTLHDFMREKIESVFRTKVINRYGSREVGNICCQVTPSSFMSIAPVNYIDIEPVNNSTSGRLLITNLVNYSMPLIKYDIGDMGATNENLFTESMTPWKILTNVDGRSSDIFLMRDGGVVSPMYLIHLLGVVLKGEYVRKFQVIQESLDEIRLLIIPSDGRVALPHGVEVETIERIKKVIGNEVSVRVEYVSDIPLTTNGKHRFTISKVTRS